MLRHVFFLAMTGIALVLASQSVSAQPAAPANAQELELKNYALESEMEVNDFVQLLKAVYPKLTAKPVPASGTGTGTVTKLPPPPTMTRLPRMTVVHMKTVVFRATKPELEAIDKVFKLLRSNGAETEEFIVLKLHHCRVDEVVTGLGALELSDRVIALRGNNSLLVLSGSEPQTQQIKKFVEVCEKSEPKTGVRPTEKTEPKTIGPKVSPFDPKLNPGPKVIEKAPVPKVTGKTETPAPKTEGKVEPK
jgi:hypothetical protein